MDATNSAGDKTPMHKQETVKDDGRLLIYYTFPAEGARRAESSPTAEQETPHV